MRIKALVLAGGRSRRFGGDKALALLEGRALVEHVMGAFAGLPVAISGGDDPGRLAGFGVTVLGDGEWTGQGPLAGLAAGLEWAADADVLVTAPCDTPFLPPGLAGRLLPAPAYARCRRDHFLVASWRTDDGGRLREMLRGGERKVEGFSRAVGARPVLFEDDGRVFRNINYREDLAAAERDSA